MKIKVSDIASYIFMLLPLLICYFTFYIIPLIFTGVYSMFDWNNYSTSMNFIGFSNYLKVFEDRTLLLGVKNSLIYAITTVTLQNIIALPVAVALNSKIKFRNGFRAIFFSPAILSTLVVGYLWNYILSSSDYGLLNIFLNRIGINSINWLGDANLALGAIISTQVWQWFGWAMVIYLANLQSIGQDLYEAASIDGCTKIQVFKYITFPLLNPAIKINIITGMIAGLKVFDIVISLTKGGPGYATETILTLMFSKFSEGNFGYASSFGIVFLVISMLFAGIMLRIFKVWEDRIG